MTKKNLFAALMLLYAPCTAFAGGYLTNTNQSASFLRFPAQEGVISTEGAIYNPAGVNFLNPGWHMVFSNQSAFQTRTACSTFPFYAIGEGNNGKTTKTYKGKATAPIIPSFDAAYVKGRWAGSFHFGIVGGGGKCEFSDGLGSFESVVSVMPTALNGITNALGMGDLVDNNYYSMNSYMRGRQYYFGGQLNVGYKLNDHISVSVGGRLVYATCNYYGYVKDINVRTATTPTTTMLGVAGQTMPVGMLLEGAGTKLGSTGMTDMGAMLNNVEVNCDQSGYGFAPVLGVNLNYGKLNVGARYEFKTRLRLKNASTTTDAQAALMPNLAEFVDGGKIPADIPAMLGVGVKYEFTPKLRAALSGHYYFDKAAHQYENKQDLLDGDTWELLAGVEYDFSKNLTASIGGQSTNYGLGKDKKYISDLSFVTSSYTLGGGVKYRCSDKVAVTLSYFKTFYYSTRKSQADYNGLSTTLQNIAGVAAMKGIVTPAQATAIAANVKTAADAGQFAGNDLLDRTNDVFGVSVEFNF